MSTNGKTYVPRLAQPGPPGTDPLANAFPHIDPVWEKKLIALLTDEHYAELTAELQMQSRLQGEVTGMVKDGVVVAVRFDSAKAEETLRAALAGNDQQ